MNTAAAAPGAPLVTLRLSVMMFLQFFLWGAWYVTLGPFMNSRGMSDEAIGNAYSVGPVAAILAPVFLGLVADRYLPTQIVLGLMHIIGGVLLFVAPSLVPAEGGSPWPFVGILFAHMLCYMPTLGLSNTVAFQNITKPETQFPLIRVLGTIGWIVAGFVVAFLAKQAAGEGASEKVVNSQAVFFQAAGASGVLLGLFSFALPNTPPPAKGKPFVLADALGLESIKLLKDFPFLIFVVSSFLICIPLAAYYSFAGVYAGKAGLENIPVKMSFGQMSEIAFMLVMPLFFARLGVKWMLAVGMLSWVIRYVLFGAAWGGAGAEHVKWMVLGGIILHGICYDFFFVTGQIYVDKQAPVTVRAQAQGFLVLITQGLGMLVGSQIFPRLVGHFTTGEGDASVVNWKMVWFIPAGFALVVMLFFMAAFNDKSVSANAAEGAEKAG